MAAVLRKLSTVTDAEAAAKLAALRRVRDAFVLRRGASCSSPTRPCASHFILQEACDTARLVAHGSGAAGDLIGPTANDDVQSCTFFPRGGV